MVPKPFVYLSITLLMLLLLPPAIIARARANRSPKPRIHIFLDMDNQAKFKAKQANPIYRDDRAMRPPVSGTVSRGTVTDDELLLIGVTNGAWSERLPPKVPMTRATLDHGRERYGIYCAMCHGVAGYGDGIVHVRASELMNNPAIGNGTTWVQPKSMHDPDIRVQPVGQIYNTITNGIRNMSAYAAQIPTEDRWAIAAYVKALQRSQNAQPSDVPAAMRRSLPMIDLIPEETEE